jgi:hypothetical protein
MYGVGDWKKRVAIVELGSLTHARKFPFNPAAFARCRQALSAYA